MSGASKAGCLRAALLALAVAVPGGTASAGDVCPQEKWEYVAPASAGWSGEGLARVEDYLKTLDTKGLVIVQDGRVIYEYGQPHASREIASMRKSVLSILVGIQHDRGKIKLDKTLAQMGIVEDKTGALTADEQGATTEQLLEARGCIYLPSVGLPESWVAGMPARSSCKPGERWYYNNWDFNALAEVFRQQSGSDLFDALKTDLAEPLQFEDFSKWIDTRYRNGVESRFPLYEMRISNADLARIGLLMARGGDWCGKRIVSREWVERSTRPISKTTVRNLDYGYLWWVAERSQQVTFFGNKPPGRSFAALGAGGQYVFVNPELQLVVTHTVDRENKRAAREVGYTSFGKLLGLILEARGNPAGT
ncbi:serine hydrolase [Uliginosibacterium sp. H3]|uniref:Serine hydrolase n=1 Tax=Uliginosibacterium silvisoli TaxID=3114758 RepID=A0ABU6K0R9_9RHOO|nr:serine hydrolase [Uliginosibacterium sp. H3]